MPEKIHIYYEGWGECWHWGTLASSTTLTGRPLILFEYSDEALSKGVELSSYLLPLNETKLRKDFPAHQLGLPGPVYDALPDGWGMLLMDRLFKRNGLNPARISPLVRLGYIGDKAMGAMSFRPVSLDDTGTPEEITLEKIAQDVQTVLDGEGGEFLQQLMLIGGSPQGARPKVLLYRNPETGVFSTAETANLEAWLIKFPAQAEHPEVCAIEAVYSQCLRECGISTPDTLHFNLPNAQAAFATKRFDRLNNMRVPMQSLAAFTGANYQSPGALDYANFLRATQICTNDAREKTSAFERAVFNVVFNNRDDHPKNFAYIMSAKGQWQLAPAYDVTFCEGPGGYHQMDIMGEALHINRKVMVSLGVKEADLSPSAAENIIDRYCAVAEGFSHKAQSMFGNQITKDTLQLIQGRINENINLLKA